MMYAQKIHMKPGCSNSYKCVEIDTIYIEGANPVTYYKKAEIYDYLQSNPKSIKVKDSTGPYLQGVVSVNYEKYVRSEPNDTTKDNLLALPRE